MLSDSLRNKAASPLCRLIHKIEHTCIPWRKTFLETNWMKVRKSTYFLKFPCLTFKTFNSFPCCWLGDIELLGFPCGSAGKEYPCNAVMWETCVQSLGWEDPLENEKATHSSILAWRSQSQTWLSNFHFHELSL